MGQSLLWVPAQDIDVPHAGDQCLTIPIGQLVECFLICQLL
ncbi:MAG: hypothetical protein ACFNLW_00825 [Olsenella sp.]